MGNYVELNDDNVVLNSDRDSIVIRNIIETKVGGCALDVKDFTDSVIEAGHIVIFNPETGVYKPMPVDEGEYGTLPEGFEYYGFVIASVLKKLPAVGVMTRGSVNPECMKYKLGAIEEAVKTALPHITFRAD